MEKEERLEMNLFLTESLEDYILSIYELQSRIVRIKDIARLKKVKLPSVVNAIKILSDMGLVEHEKYGYVTLTDYGIEVAQELYRRRKLLFRFFTEILGVDENTALQDSHRIEHDLSPKSLEKLTEFTERFIKSRKEEKDMPLTLKDLKVGEEGKIVELRGGGGIISRLLSMGAVPGTIVKVEKIAPLGDPIEILILGYHLSLRKEEAEKILVERI